MTEPRRIPFDRGHHGPRSLIIEADGALVTVTVGLADEHGRHVTRVTMSPDDASRGGDGQGYLWFQPPGDARVIRHARCRHCAAPIIPVLAGWLHNRGNRTPAPLYCDDTQATTAQPEEGPS